MNDNAKMTAADYIPIAVFLGFAVGIAWLVTKHRL